MLNERPAMTRKRQGKLLPMMKFREIIRLHELGRNQTEIARSCGVARSTVQDYTRRADAKSVSYAALEQMSDSDAQTLLGKSTSAPIEAKEIAFSPLHQELSQKGVTLALLWQEGLRPRRLDAKLRSVLPPLQPVEGDAEPVDASDPQTRRQRAH